MKRIVFTVTNDLSYDQRMNRICTSLANAGYDVTLVGRKRRASQKLGKKLFGQHRIKCFFEKGKLFYLEYNFKLFWYLLFHKCNIICAIDLDTVVPAFAVSKLRRKPLVYDAHEYFTEMEEVVARPMIKRAWERVEKFIVPKIKHAYTVSEGYAELFEKKYGTKFHIIRNATVLNENPTTNNKQATKYILYQGAVNVGRGLENLLHAMQQINGKLYICGKGDIYSDLRILSKELQLEGKVVFCGYIEPELLREYTHNATVGITFFSNKGLSNHYSLANRFFDYLHAGVPQVAMNYPEYVKFCEEFKVATLIDNLEANTIATAINELLNNENYYSKMRQDSFKAREVYNWQNEEKKLLGIYERIT